MFFLNLGGQLQDWCGLCHCIDCYRLYNQRKETEEAEAEKAKRRTKSDVTPWTEDWFDQIVQFRKKSFWECH